MISLMLTIILIEEDIFSAFRCFTYFRQPEKYLKAYLSLWRFWFINKNKKRDRGSAVR